MKYTLLLSLIISSLLFGCGDWPPIVENEVDVLKLPVNQEFIRARGLKNEDIGSLSRLQNLASLDFQSGWQVKEAPISDKGLEKLISFNLPNLQTLSLGFCKNITDRGLIHIAKIPTITWLSLSECPGVTDKGLFYISEMSSLRGLDLRGSKNITDKGLSNLMQMQNLRTLLLGGCSNITPAGIDKLKTALPSCTIKKNDKEWESSKT